MNLSSAFNHDRVVQSQTLNHSTVARQRRCVRGQHTLIRNRDRLEKRPLTPRWRFLYVINVKNLPV